VPRNHLENAASSSLRPHSQPKSISKHLSNPTQPFLGKRQHCSTLKAIDRPSSSLIPNKDIAMSSTIPIVRIHFRKDNRSMLTPRNSPLWFSTAFSKWLTLVGSLSFSKCHIYCARLKVDGSNQIMVGRNNLLFKDSTPKASRLKPTTLTRVSCIVLHLP